MKRNSPAAARRYARALFDVALRQGQAEGVNAALASLATLLRGNKELTGVLQRPTVPPAKKKAILRSVLGGAEGLAARFLDILVDQGRIIDAPDVALAFDTLWNAHRNVARAQIVSARELDETEVASLKAALEKLTGTGIEAQTRVDPDMIGGVVVSVAGLTYDGSVRTQLESLHTRLTGAV